MDNNKTQLDEIQELLEQCADLKAMLESVSEGLSTVATILIETPKLYGAESEVTYKTNKFFVENFVLAAQISANYAIQLFNEAKQKKATEDDR